ncbi:hypothetical protein [Priestia aryabhattai]|uniref:Uncharacterized protein n=1 Tax=Priestia aryabhattai TaxID=412384 RepID=A0ABD7X3E3_PRIAR|nr:hypothetical protein [Priestia aryabhattai]WEA46831.1 hypothetical protein PWO00_12965 [Priestia aryabhattai]
MNPTLHDQLKQWKKDKAVVEKVIKRTENLSTRDVMDLMGTNRQILTRGKGGAYRQK